eukprot:1186553-Amorphochlora_amoeboformis.AAC.3
MDEVLGLILVGGLLILLLICGALFGDVRCTLVAVVAVLVVVVGCVVVFGVVVVVVGVDGPSRGLDFLSTCLF